MSKDKKTDKDNTEPIYTSTKINEVNVTMSGLNQSFSVRVSSHDLTTKELIKETQKLILTL